MPARNTQSRGPTLGVPPFCIVCLGRQDHSFRTCNQTMLFGTQTPTFTHRLGPSSRLQTCDG